MAPWPPSIVFSERSGAYSSLKLTRSTLGPALLSVSSFLPRFLWFPFFLDVLSAASVSDRSWCSWCFVVSFFIITEGPRWPVPAHAAHFQHGIRVTEYNLEKNISSFRAGWHFTELIKLHYTYISSFRQSFTYFDEDHAINCYDVCQLPTLGFDPLWQVMETL